MEKRWSHPTILPLITFTINDMVNSETGVRPFDAKFGSEDGTYCRLPSMTESAKLTAAWIKNLNTDLTNIRKISKAIQSKIIEERLKNNPTDNTQNQYCAGDFILYKYPTNHPRPTKLSSPYLVS